MPRNDYDPVNDLWPTVLPPITAQEADAARRALVKRFGVRDDACALQSRPMTDHRPVRRVWVSRKPTGVMGRGWARLVHDVSHRVFKYRHPGWRTHEHGHAVLELEMAWYVLTQTDWLQGGLRAPPKTRALKSALAGRTVHPYSVPAGRS
jgi:hypothetical protein